MNNDREPNEPIWQSVQVRDIFYKLKKIKNLKRQKGKVLREKKGNKQRPEIERIRKVVEECI